MPRSSVEYEEFQSILTKENKVLFGEDTLADQDEIMLVPWEQAAEYLGTDVIDLEVWVDSGMSYEFNELADKIRHVGNIVYYTEFVTLIRYRNMVLYMDADLNYNIYRRKSP